MLLTLYSLEDVLLVPNDLDNELHAWGLTKQD